MARVTGLNRQLAVVTVELNTRATTDALTGLANRTAFHDRLAMHLMEPARVSTNYVLLVDLDDFKDVNDSLGHAAGDELLRAVAVKLEASVRPGDLVARLGGDEFAVLLNDLPDGAAAFAIAERTVAMLAAPVTIAGTTVQVAASVGLTVRQNDSDVDSLLREADVAMYSAKGNGKNRVVLYDPALEHAVDDLARLKADVLNAARRGELVVDYQPLIELATGRVMGVEALVRWQHPTRGLLPPSVFIGPAEANGAIIDIGAWVLATAARQVHSWQHRHHRPDLVLSVNASVRELEQPDFAVRVLDLLRETELPPASLVIEVTESVLANPSNGAAECLDELRRMGVRVAIDDFGSGYSSLGYLRQLPIDILKIDRSFVSGQHSGTQGQALLEGIVGLGRHLGMEVIPEGIEETAELGYLQSLGCVVGQGFLLARPASAATIDATLSSAALTARAHAHGMGDQPSAAPVSRGITPSRTATATASSLECASNL
jgi:diguanylate cyclase (GGDEF)-like protein